MKIIIRIVSLFLCLVLLMNPALSVYAEEPFYQLLNAETGEELLSRKGADRLDDVFLLKPGESVTIELRYNGHPPEILTTGSVDFLMMDSSDSVQFSFSEELYQGHIRKATLTALKETEKPLLISYVNGHVVWEFSVFVGDELPPFTEEDETPEIKEYRLYFWDGEKRTGEIRNRIILNKENNWQQRIALFAVDSNGNESMVTLQSGDQSQKNFHSELGVELKFYGDGSVLLFGISNSSGTDLRYGLRNDSVKTWRDLVKVEGLGYTWYVNGKAYSKSNTFNVDSSGTFFLQLKRNGEWLPLNRETCEIYNAFNYVELVDDYTMKVQMVNYRFTVKYWLDEEKSVYLEFASRYKDGKPFFAGGMGEYLEEWNFNTSQAEKLLKLTGTPNVDLDVIDPDLLEYDENIIEIQMREDNAGRFYVVPKRNGKTLLRYPVNFGGNGVRWAELAITVNVSEKDYTLYDDNDRPLYLLSGDGFGIPVTNEYPLRLKEMRDGKIVADRTQDIVKLEVLRCKDSKGFADDMADQCLFAGQDENGQFAVFTRNEVQGQFQMELRVHLSDGQYVDFTLSYTVSTSNSDKVYFYVGDQLGDYKTIQSALDAAMASDISMKYVIIREGIYSGEQINSETPGILNMKILQSTGRFRYFSVSAEGQVTIKGNLFIDNRSFDVVTWSGITFDGSDVEAGNDSAITVVNGDVSLQNMKIENYNIGINAKKMYANGTRDVTVRNCNVGMQLTGDQRDGAAFVYRDFCFMNNDTAVLLEETVKGKLKLRSCDFIENNRNLVDTSRSCSVNAAFNSFIYDDMDYDSELYETFGSFDDEKDFFSPYYREESNRAKWVYIDPHEMNDLVIDAKEANRQVHTGNFLQHKMLLNLADVQDDGSYTSDDIYAVWNFSAAEEVETESFNPLITTDLSLAAQKVVDEAVADGKIKNYQPVSFRHHGILHEDALVSLRKTTELNGDTFYLYKIENGRLILQQEDVSFDGTMYHFVRGSCSDYIIVDTIIEETEYSDHIGDVDKTVPDSSDYIAFSEIAEKLAKAGKGKSVSLIVGNRPRISARIFEELAKYPDKALVLKGDNYRWTFKGANMLTTLSTSVFDSSVSSISPEEKEIRKLTGNADLQLICTAYHGELPGWTTLTIQVKESLQDKKLYCYYYNEKTKKLELIQNNLYSNANHAINLQIDHCSTYILTDREFSSVDISSMNKVNPLTGA